MKKVAKTGTPRKTIKVRRAIGEGVRQRRRLQRIMGEERNQTPEAKAAIKAGVNKAIAEEGKKGGRPKGTPQTEEAKAAIGAGVQAANIAKKYNDN